MRSVRTVSAEISKYGNMDEVQTYDTYSSDQDIHEYLMEMASGPKMETRSQCRESRHQLQDRERDFVKQTPNAHRLQSLSQTSRPQLNLYLDYKTQSRNPNYVGPETLRLWKRLLRNVFASSDHSWTQTETNTIRAYYYSIQNSSHNFRALLGFTTSYLDHQRVCLEVGGCSNIRHYLLQTMATCQFLRKISGDRFTRRERLILINSLGALQNIVTDPTMETELY